MSLPPTNSSGTPLAEVAVVESLRKDHTPNWYGILTLSNTLWYLNTVPDRNKVPSPNKDNTFPSSYKDLA